MTNFNHPLYSQDLSETRFAELNLAETLSFLDDSAAAGFFSADEATLGFERINQWFDTLPTADARLRMLCEVSEQMQTIVTLRRLQAVRVS